MQAYVRPLSLGIVIVGVSLSCGCAAAAHARLGWLAWGVYAGGLLALAAVWLARRNKTLAEQELQAAREALERDRAEVQRQRDGLNNLKDAAEAALEKQGQIIDQRERRLAQKLIAFHEWLEFPQAIDADLPEPEERDLAELSKKDREVLALLDAEAKRFYEDIRTNKYSPEGEFDVRLLRSDIDHLAKRVARIYRPESENPLLETSLDQILRALGRTSLHLLVVLDRLPLGVKEYNINSLYRYVRQATKAYGAYKAAEPYIPYLNGAYYLSRFVMGASPWTLVAWRAVSEISTRGAKLVAAQWFNRQAAAVVYDMVRVIGFEVAGIYGGDFRHRDASWVYGAELTELISCFPLSRDALSHGLKEIGSLRLRNEYDRLFLYQCLAAHASARPDRYRASVHLVASERRAIAQRLEKFFQAFIHGKTDERVAAWREEAEKRLVVKLDLESTAAPVSVESQRRDAIRSLASFLIAAKEREPHEIADWLGQCKVFRERPVEQQEQMLAELRENPPYFFEQPDLDPGGAVVADYLDDLARLMVRVAPFDVPTDNVMDDVALFLRADAKELQRNIDAKRETMLRERLQNPPVGKLTPDVVRAVIQQLGPDERPVFLYGQVQLEWPQRRRRGLFSQGENWLLGCGDRALLVHVAENGEADALWTGGSDVSVQRLKGYLADDCMLHGGTWMFEGAPHPEKLRIPGHLGRKWELHFKPLLDFFVSLRPAGSTEP
jgi:hypothetical protein